ncbi:Type 1 glutamine amidotransferase-like domain-containing protein [Brevibacterium sp. RIT 803]|uniref:Type 1 glutamine amidotransferase-like domain-containing protein n=1 Tax=Brevibacterium sp. RIT 803 TaxID=2810210 RepID=UPI00207987AB|nr:Type 1 glutamine amidotransferase-like domain-containing protein [Brevibacterium sp. RIT 803]
MAEQTTSRAHRAMKDDALTPGANCWFEASSTDSFGPLAPLNDGFGLIPGSACPHYHGEPGRVETFRTWIEAGQLPGPGLAIDDHAAVVFDNSRATSVIAEKFEAHAYVVDGRGETRLDAGVDNDPANSTHTHAGTVPRQVLR